MNSQIVEEIMDHFGRTGAKNRPRIRKFHAELLACKFDRKERVINQSELSRPKPYLDRMIKFSKGFLEYINEEAGEIKITDLFFDAIATWYKRYTGIEELDLDDANLVEQGIILEDETVRFDGRLLYSKFYKIVSDEGEGMNDPSTWKFSTNGLESFDILNFNEKNSPAFSSHLFLLKFYVLRKIDEVAFVTSRFVHCPVCGANYVIPASKIEFQTSYKCENVIGDKICKTALKKFPARKMIPTYIYEIAIEVRTKDGTEFKEFFLESFVDLQPGFFTGTVFGRTEAKTDSFYFLCLTANEEKSKIPFELTIKDAPRHKFFDIIDCIKTHIRKVGFILDDKKAMLVFYIETLKRLNQIVNKNIDLDHSLYFGAPGIGKTFAVNLLSHFFYSNYGFISGPRFSLPGLTGGQKEVIYQDTSKKKNVPGLFSMQSFLFDEINNANFLEDNKAMNLFKSAALAPSGTSSTVGGKEFPRLALITGTANYDPDHLRHYENKVKKRYNELSKACKVEKSETELFVQQLVPTPEISLPDTFDYYLPLRSYNPEVNNALKLAVLRVREEDKHYLTNFPKPLMERFYWSILIHPKFDKSFVKHKKIDVASHFQTRYINYTQRELIAQLFVSNFEELINKLISKTKGEFIDKKIEAKWSEDVEKFLAILSSKYIQFFSMFHRIQQVHIFSIYTLCLINNETKLSFATKRLYERLISVCHTPIDLKDFHDLDFENYRYVGESRGEILKILKLYPNQDIREFVDYDNRKIVREVLLNLRKERRIQKIKDYYYTVVDKPQEGIVDLLKPKAIENKEVTK